MPVPASSKEFCGRQGRTFPISHWAEAAFTGPGTVVERVTAYLRRERDALKGCPVGRLTQDPDVMANPDLRRPVEETFAWLTARLAGPRRRLAG